MSADPRRLSQTDWDTNWMLLANEFEKLPPAALARQHEGWSSTSSEGGAGETSKAPERKPRDRPISDSARLFPHPLVSLPAPTLKFDFRMAVRLNKGMTKLEIPGAEAKELATISGGTWSGSFGSGVVAAGGHDLKSAKLDGRPGAKIDAAFRLHTIDDPPARIEMRTRGCLAGDFELLMGLLDQTATEDVDPRKYYFRMFMTLRTTDERYAEDLNFALWIGSGKWNGPELMIDAYRVS